MHKLYQLTDLKQADDLSLLLGVREQQIQRRFLQIYFVKYICKNNSYEKEVYLRKELHKSNIRRQILRKELFKTKCKLAKKKSTTQQINCKNF